MRSTECSIEVEDESGGLPLRKTAELFRAFEQRNADCTGLGLGVSRWAIEANEGLISPRNLPRKRMRVGRRCAAMFSASGRAFVVLSVGAPRAVGARVAFDVARCRSTFVIPSIAGNRHNESSAIPFPQQLQSLQRTAPTSRGGRTRHLAHLRATNPLTALTVRAGLSANGSPGRRWRGA